MSTQTIGAAASAVATPPQTSRWRSLVTQESVATLVVSVIVAAAVLLPLFTLVVSSFRVLDPGGFDTTWGLDNYKTLFSDRIIPKAFVNTLLISAGSTVVATFFGVQAIRRANEARQAQKKAESLLYAGQLQLA